jgi:hypothetical protein
VRHHLSLPVSELLDEALIDLFLWATKILFGLMYRGLFTTWDPKEASLGTVFDKESIRQFEQMHLLLQGIRNRLYYRGPTSLPGSFSVFEVLCPENIAGQFDWRDNPHTQSLYVRLGDRAILLSQDGGAQTLAVGDILARHQKRSLHPLQIEELAAKFLYKATLRERFPVYAMADDGRLFVACMAYDYADAPAKIMSKEEGGKVAFVALPNPNDDGRPLFRDWEWDEYHLVLSHLTKLRRDSFVTEEGRITWLLTPDDDDLHLDFDKLPH